MKTVEYMSKTDAERTLTSIITNGVSDLPRNTTAYYMKRVFKEIFQQSGFLGGWQMKEKDVYTVLQSNLRPAARSEWLGAEREKALNSTLSKVFMAQLQEMEAAAIGANTPTPCEKTCETVEHYFA